MKTHQQQRHPKKQNGFTLIELLVTLVIAGVLLSVGVPSFNGFMKKNLLATTNNKFITALHLARSEAIKRGGRVTVCKSSDGATCITTGAWQQGWIVFTDENNSTPPVFSPAAAVPETLLNVTPALSTNLVLTGNLNVANYISYVSSGQSQLTSGAFQAGTVSLCDDRSGNFGSNIVLNRTGRTSLNKGIACP
ncbi:MAG: hypothetical protein COB62_04450 [Piscirickettsiaceae bacterium]|nr:MAG: hypothetical protein COB62_04450 [Piscirickettsiaceae bacterium]